MIFINSDADTDDPKYSYTRKITTRSIPVMFATGDAATMLKDKEGSKVSMTAEIQSVTKSPTRYELGS